MATLKELKDSGKYAQFLKQAVSGPIDLVMVRSVLDCAGGLSLGVLCTSNKVNKYARFRPGYWITQNTELTFIAPRGSGYVDARGTDPETGIHTEAYKLGDFRGYNHRARTPGYDNDKVTLLPVSSDYGNSTISIELAFYIGECDWFSEETAYRGKNALGAVFSQVVAVRHDTTNKTVVGVVNKADLEKGDGYDRRAIFPLSLPVPSSTQGQIDVVLRFALGNTNKPYAYFPGIEKVYRVIRNSRPIYFFMVPQSAYAAMKVKLQGLSQEDSANQIYNVLISNAQGTFVSGSTVINVSNLIFQVQMYPTFNVYDITQMRWSVGGRVVILKDNIEQSSFEWSQVVANQGYNQYNFNISLPSIALDGYTYRVEITKFNGTILVVPTA